MIYIRSAPIRWLASFPKLFLFLIAFSSSTKSSCPKAAQAMSSKPMSPIKGQRKSEEKKWKYEKYIMPGKLRLITTASILEDDPWIIVLQYPHLDISKSSHDMPRWAAISHSWKASAEVGELSWKAGEPLHIEVEEETLHTDNINTISWHGLRQAAKAAEYLGLDFLWLDQRATLS